MCTLFFFWWALLIFYLNSLNIELKVLAMTISTCGCQDQAANSWWKKIKAYNLGHSTVFRSCASCWNLEVFQYKDLSACSWYWCLAGICFQIVIDGYMLLKLLVDAKTLRYSSILEKELLLTVLWVFKSNILLYIMLLYSIVLFIFVLFCVGFLFYFIYFKAKIMNEYVSHVLSTWNCRWPVWISLYIWRDINKLKNILCCFSVHIN